MFAGLVETLGEVAQIESAPPGQRLSIHCGPTAEGAQVGDSICVSGCCLTVVQVDGPNLTFEAGPETLRCTSLGELNVGDQVNLERSLAVGDRLGGHFVTGHVDAVGYVDQRIDDDRWSTLWFRCPDTLTRQMASKGSVAVDGISLTIVDVESKRFSVALIPHTLNVTTLGQKQVGQPVNLETDLLAKYVQQQLQFSTPTTSRHVI